MRNFATKQDTSNLSSGIVDIGPNLTALIASLFAPPATTTPPAV